MELPSTSISKYDVAAFMALLNMVKANLTLGQRPEVYHTLLAVLVDYNPAQTGNKERTVRYIRLLIPDEDLANLLIMYLPEHVQVKLTESYSTTRSQCTRSYPQTSRSSLVQKVKVKHVKRRRTKFKPWYARRISSDNVATNQIVTPEMESAATSLLQMSSNAAARIQSRTSGSANSPSFSAPEASKQTGNKVTEVQTNSFDKKLPSNVSTQCSNTAVVKPQSVSLSAMEQLFFGTSARSQSPSTSALVVRESERSETETRSTSIQTGSQTPVTEDKCSCAVNMVKSKAGHISTTSNITYSTSYQGSSVSANQTVSFTPVSSATRYNIANVDPCKGQTVQNYCQNLYQGVNLYASPATPHLQGQPATPHLQGQPFPFLQPLLNQQVPAIPYQLPSFPYVSYQTGYQYPMAGQTPTWTYIPAAENQYPLNLSLQTPVSAATAAQQPHSQPQHSNSQNQDLNIASVSRQSDGQTVLSVGTIKITEPCVKRLRTDLDTEPQKKVKQDAADAPSETVASVSGEAKTSFQTFVTKSNASQTILVPTAANMVTNSSVGEPKVKSDIQALTDLTLGVGRDSGSKDTRIYLGAGMKDGNALQKSQSNIKSSSPNNRKDILVQKEISCPNSTKISSTLMSLGTNVFPVIKPSDEHFNIKRSGETIYIDRNRKILSLNSFPYSQEIRIPDPSHRSFIKLQNDSSTIKNIGKVQVPLDGNLASKNIQTQGTAKTVKELLQLQNSCSSRGNDIKPVYLGAEESNSIFRTCVPRINHHTSCTVQSEMDVKRMFTRHTKQDENNNVLDLVRSGNVGLSEKMKTERSGITVEINEGNKLHAGEKNLAKQRSMSDGSCSSDVDQNTGGTGAMGDEKKLLKSSRNRNMKSEGDVPGEAIVDRAESSNKSSESLKTIGSSEMVHVGNKIVTVKVPKYPDIKLQNKSLYANPELGMRAQNDIMTWRNSPLHIEVGKSPVVKSKLQETSHLSLEERQYLDQIQHLNRNLYQSSSLAQLLMKDFKVSECNMKGNPVPHNASETENVNPDTELVVGRMLNLYLPSKPKRALSDSEVLGHISSDKLNLDADGGESGKCPNTFQDDDVFLENEPVSQLDLRGGKIFSGKQPINECGDGKRRF